MQADDREQGRRQEALRGTARDQAGDGGGDLEDQQHHACRARAATAGDRRGTSRDSEHDRPRSLVHHCTWKSAPAQ
ncbi:hypothetical protein GCM10010358_12130 [Streptomyces minutiscleroticus]|uniref:Uncharacterized protein n=1 Tax=Streptomyces minutiscleroticus TaxID=68238 RepID=A0A918KEG3_9ACTN|nr:hypothetical protein GCM10010358_12130 [Streptomyces minutiscleroticus]